MPHKHCTRTKTNSIPKMNYVYDSSNSSVTSGSDYDYSDNSSENNSENSSENGSCDDYNDNNDDYDNYDNYDNSFNKRDYYKFLSELYPSTYSKNKYNALDYETKNHENKHKRAKKAHTTNFDPLTTINKHNLFNSKIIKKKHSAVYKKNYIKMLIG